MHGFYVTGSYILHIGYGYRTISQIATTPPSLHTSKKKETRKQQGGIIYFEGRHVSYNRTFGGKEWGGELDRLTRDTYK